MFDPAAATRAYLASIPPQVRAQAETATLWSHVQALGALAVVLLVCWALARSRLPSRRGSLAMAAAVGVATAAALAGWNGFCAWRAAGALHPLPAYVAVALPNPIAALIALALCALAYALVRRFPRVGPPALTVAAALAVFALNYAPYALSLSSRGAPAMPAGPLRTQILALAGSGGLPLKTVYVSAEPVVEADVTGTPGDGRIVVTRRMLAQEDARASLANVGHVLGHFAHRDQLAYAGLLAALTLAAGLGMILLFRPAARLMGSAAGGLSDPAGLPVLVALAALAMAVSAPLINGFIRHINVRADAWSLEHARDPDGLVRHLMLTRTEQNPDAPAWEEALFYSHRPLRFRIEQAMAWKAAHQP